MQGRPAIHHCIAVNVIRLDIEYRLTPWLLGGLALSGWLTAVVFILLWEKQMHQPVPFPSIPPSSGIPS